MEDGLRVGEVLDVLQEHQVGQQVLVGGDEEVQVGVGLREDGLRELLQVLLGREAEVLEDLGF